jgi:hypothetical protein
MKRASVQLASMLVLLVTLVARPGVSAALVGDCGNDGEVTIDELTLIVGIVLGSQPLSACPPGDGNGDGSITIDEVIAAVGIALNGPPTTATPTPTQSPTPTPTSDACDPIADPCMLPWPNDYFTVEDASTPTGRRLSLVAEALPVNTRGAHVNPADQNRADGWSPGSPVLVRIAGLDAEQSKLPGLPDAQASLAADSPVVLLDATTGQRHPFWAELDTIADPGETPLLMIHPAVNFADAHRIVVGLRNLVDSSGEAITPSPAFAAYRDGQPTGDAKFEARRPAMERIFSDLATAGVHRGDLQLAWDFTIASTQSLTGRMIAIRDDAFAVLGDAAPAFTVDTVTDNPDLTDNPNPSVRRRIEGTFQVPLYLTNGGRTGGRLVLDDNGRPTRQPGMFTANYVCNLPPAAASTPARMSLYGHGLLGSRTEVNGSLTRTMSAGYNIAYCATDWSGMAEDDVPTALGALTDMSKFPAIPDRMQQGFLAFLFLGRLMKHPQGFSANDAFRFGGQSALKTDEATARAPSSAARSPRSLRTSPGQRWARRA